VDHEQLISENQPDLGYEEQETEDQGERQRQFDGGLTPGSPTRRPQESIRDTERKTRSNSEEIRLVDDAQVRTSVASVAAASRTRAYSAVAWPR
jgi:hypothetical protein